MGPAWSNCLKFQGPPLVIKWSWAPPRFFFSIPLVGLRSCSAMKQDHSRPLFLVIIYFSSSSDITINILMIFSDHHNIRSFSSITPFPFSSCTIIHHYPPSVIIFLIIIATFVVTIIHLTEVRSGIALEVWGGPRRLPFDSRNFSEDPPSEGS